MTDREHEQYLDILKNYNLSDEYTIVYDDGSTLEVTKQDIRDDTYGDVYSMANDNWTSAHVYKQEKKIDHFVIDGHEVPYDVVQEINNDEFDAKHRFDDEYEESTMKKLNITKEQFNHSNYFQRKYGKLEYVSESGKLFKTSKGKVLKFNESRRDLEPTNGRKSFGHKAYVEDDGDGFTLYSYNTPVARIERLESGHGQEFSLLSDYLSNTTLTHIHSFLQTYGFRDIPTRELLQMDVGDSVPMMAAESKKRLAKEAGKKVIPAANGCSIHDMGDCWIVTNKNGLNIGQCRTLIEAEDIAENAEENTRRKLGLESRKLVKEGAGAGYTVTIKNLKFGSILDKKYVKMKKDYDSYYECKVEIVPGEYEIAAEDYYNDFFWQEHEFGDTPKAKIDGGVATIIYSPNSYDPDEAEEELRGELENTTLDEVSFDYGGGWVHVDLPREKIEIDRVKVGSQYFYGSIDKIELNAPDLAYAVNSGYKSIDDRDSEAEEDNGEEYDESIDSESSEWRVFDYGEDFPYTERYTVLDPDGYSFFISHNGGVGAFTEDALEGDSDEIAQALEIEIEDQMWKPVELSKREMLDNKTVMKGLRRIKEKYDYDDQD